MGLLASGVRQYHIGKRLGLATRTVKAIMRDLYVEYGIPPDQGVPQIRLAVIATYERHPDLIPFGGQL